MSLAPGTRIGHYQIAASLGAGGMGEVYRARDTELDRDVALKILPDTFAADPERLARFEREAKTLASLNHPNIAHLHGIERTVSVRALVMELVEGQDLAAHIRRGPVQLADAIAIARQIADALEFAHDQGIVHRDLKPANVMVRGDGTVKILDFGLAKAFASDASGTTPASPSDSPTLTAQTRFGMILGTAAYMAPEQARGKSVDKRADIWAFGVVLFEMLTGERLFKGEEISDVLAAVLRQDIDWTRLPPNTPPRLRRLLARCLDRDPKTRLRDIGEARVDLARIERGDHDDASATKAAPIAAASRSRREAIAWAAAGIAALAAFSLWITRAPGIVSSETGKLVRLTFLPSDNVVAEAGGAQISPDGQKLVFSGRGADGRSVLWLRRLDAVEATPLPDTENAIEPFWSPDSKSIAFGAQGKLKRLDLGAARAQVLTDAARSNNGTWNASGTIVFSPDYRSVLYRVAATGGQRTPVTQGDADQRYPYFLPDGRHFLYTSGRRILVGLLDSTDTKEVLAEAPATAAIYAPPGWLIYLRNGTLVAHAFDTTRLELSGDPIPLSLSPQGTNWPQGMRASVSKTGVLVLQNGPQYEYQQRWYDRSGKFLNTFGPVRRVAVPEYPHLSPDGTRVVVQRYDPATQNQDLWLGDVARGTYDRFTTNPAQEQIPVWSSDGRNVFFTTTRNGVGGIYRAPVGGGGEVYVAKGTVFSGDVSPDGKWFFFTERGETTRLDIWVQPAVDVASDADKHPPRSVVHSEADDSSVQVSPDGHWIAYVSDVSGIAEVYVRRLEVDGTVSEPTRVTSGGGLQPKWSHEGRELFYLNAVTGFLTAEMMAVPLKGGTTTFDFGPSRPLFKVRMLPIQTNNRDYDVSLDGQRFLIGTTVGDARATPATIVLNWTAGLGR